MPIETTFEGISILSKLVQFANAEDSIEVIVLGSVTSFKKPQSKKSASSTLVIPSVITIFVKP